MVLRDLDIKEFAQRGQEVYEAGLRSSLESTHHGEFVAIEPDSGEQCIAPTFSEVFQLARSRFGGKVAYIVRIGYPYVHRLR